MKFNLPMILTRLILGGVAAAVFVLGSIGQVGPATAADEPAAYASTVDRTTGSGSGHASLDASVIEHIGPAGLKTYRWDFSRRGDVDFDGWPDRFTRHRETGYPEYVQIAIVARDPQLEAQVLSLDTALVLQWPRLRRYARGLPFADKLPPLPPSLADLLIDRCLEIQLDGGQARVVTPSLPTSSRFQYRFSVDVQTRDLVHDSVYAQVIFLDAEGQELQRRSTPAVTDAPRWTTLWIDHLVPPPGAHEMRVSLDVQGGPDGLQDIRGVVSFDNITFQQFPQMKVTTDKPFGVYRRGERVTAHTRLLGLPSEATQVRLHLLDHNAQELKSESRRISVADIPVFPEQSRRPTAARSQQSAAGGGSTASDVVDSVSFDWPIENLPPGYYTIAARMENDRGASLANRANFVVIDRLTDDPREWSPAAGFGAPPQDNTASLSPVFSDNVSVIDPVPFGWTLPRDYIERSRRDQISNQAISQWLRDVGVGWVKIPVWFAPEDTESADAAANLAFRLQDMGIQPVGLLDQPKADQAQQYRLHEHGESGVAAYLRDPAIWRAQLDTIMNRMTFRLRTWQIGDDDDYSFQSRPQLADHLAEIAVGLQGFGQPLEVVIPWPWLDRPPEVSGESWKGLSRHADRPLTADELDAMLDRDQQSTANVRHGATWATLDPLPKQRYDRDSRITDLVLRMATTRGHKVEAAFARRPMRPESTLVTADGRPDELLLPWRTTSLLLGRARNIGSLRLRHGSHNIVFRSDHSSVLMVWGNRPRTERLFLGDAVYQVDVWGRRSELPTEQLGETMVHVVEVGRLPIFLVGIDPALAEFRMSVNLDRKRIDSILGREQTIGVHYKNPIGQSLIGKVSLAAPPAWTIQPREKQWNLSPLESGQSDFTVVLGNNATIGPFELPIDFEFATVPPTIIRVYRELDIGPEGFDLVVSTRIMGDQLRVKIEMTNQTRRSANFDCLLFAGPRRQYERRVLTIGPGETVERDVDLINGQNLIGRQMLLRAIEQGGNRVINHTFEVTP